MTLADQEKNPITFKITVDGKIVQGIVDANMLNSLFVNRAQTDSSFYMPFNSTSSVHADLNVFKLNPVDIVVSKFLPVGQVRFYSPNFEKFSQFILTSDFQPVHTKYRERKETEIIIEKDSENSLVDLLLKGAGISKQINKIVFKADIELNPFWIPAGTLSEDNKVLTLKPGEFLPVAPNYSQLEITGPNMDPQELTTYGLFRWDANPVVHRYISLSPNLYTNEALPFTRIKDGLKGALISTTNQNNKYYFGTISAEQNNRSSRESSIKSSFSLIEDQIVYSKDDVSNFGVDTFFNYLKKNVPLPETVEKIIFKSDIIWSGKALPKPPSPPLSLDEANVNLSTYSLDFTLPEGNSDQQFKLFFQKPQEGNSTNMTFFFSETEGWKYTKDNMNGLSIDPVISGNEVSIFLDHLPLPCFVSSNSITLSSNESISKDYIIPLPPSDNTFRIYKACSYNNNELIKYSGLYNFKLIGDTKTEFTFIWDDYLAHTGLNVTVSTLLPDDNINENDYCSFSLIPTSTSSDEYEIGFSTPNVGGNHTTYLQGVTISVGDKVRFFKEGDIYSIENITKEYTKVIAAPAESWRRLPKDTDSLIISSIMQTGFDWEIRRSYRFVQFPTKLTVID